MNERQCMRAYLSTMGSRMAGTQGLGSRAALHEDVNESIKTMTTAMQPSTMVGRVIVQDQQADKLSRKSKSKAKYRTSVSPRRPSSRSRDSKLKQGKKKKKAGTSYHSPAAGVESESPTSVTKRTKQSYRNLDKSRQS